MNDAPIDEAAIAATDPRVEAAQRFFSQPTNVILTALGAGLVIGLLVRSLRPEPTAAQRLAHLLEDLEERVRDVTSPALRRAGSYAHDGADALRDGFHSGEAKVSSLLRYATDSVRKLFT